MSQKWPERIWIRGFVLRSLDIRNRPLPEVEAICGFHRGRLSRGLALYRLNGTLVQEFLDNPSKNLTNLALYPVGFNDERGQRDWKAMYAAAERKVFFNGYSVEQIFHNKEHYSPKAKPFDASDTQAVANLVAELGNLYGRGGYIAKILPVQQHSAHVENFEQYPAGAGIREYEVVEKRPFVKVAEWSSGISDRWMTC